MRIHADHYSVYGVRKVWPQLQREGHTISLLDGGAGTGRPGNGTVAGGGRKPGPDLVHHSDAGSQYTSLRFTTHLAGSGIDASIGTVGDALDNALMEAAIGLYKTDLIKRRGP